jgi:sensor histidine kinase YesM
MFIFVVNFKKKYGMTNMFDLLPKETIKAEQLKGARLMVYFRWIFVSLVAFTLTVQIFSGYKAESGHAIFLVLLYFLSNIALWWAANKAYDSAAIQYVSATLDVLIISFHLFVLTMQFDHLAATTAATIFIYPIMFLLYTFRLNRSLLIYVVLLSIFAFNFNFFIFYWQKAEIYHFSMSTTPQSHIFKGIYMLFIGFLCVHIQQSISSFVARNISQASIQNDLDTKVALEKQKNEMVEKMLEAIKANNDELEKEVEKRTLELTAANTQLLKLQKENLQSQFEVLKQQVNPHFLFNSLNVLSSLIKIDPDTAETFTEKLSKVYRYVLENKEKDLVAVSTEMEFLQSYLFLIDIRFMQKIKISIDIPQQYLDYFILPIAVQMVIENAIKHNTFSKAKPMIINVFVDDLAQLVITNTLQLRETKSCSTGIGLNNITQRYALLCDGKPLFEQQNNLFVAKLPLIKDFD